MNTHFPFKQVHLDFHTYGKIPNVGKNFSKENFPRELLYPTGANNGDFDK